MTFRTYAIDMPIRFQHVDAAGIVFYPRYIEMMNNVIEEWFREALGCPYSELHFQRRLGIPTAHMDVSFAAPTRLEEVLRLELVVVDLRTRAFVLEHCFTCGGEERLRAVHRLVCASLDDLRPVPIPSDVRERMTAYLRPPERVGAG